jgi:hypothetical protein
MSSGGWDRTSDLGLMKGAPPIANPLQDQHFGQQAPALTAGLQAPAETDPDLVRIISAWPSLPPHIRAAVMALIGTAS